MLPSPVTRQKSSVGWPGTGPFATSNQQRMLVLWAIWGMVERGGSILPASVLKASRAGYRVSMRTIVSSQPFQKFRQISIFMHLAKTYLARSQIWQGSVYAAPPPSIAGQVIITPYRGSHNQRKAHWLRSRPDERSVTVMLVLRVRLVVHAPVCNMCVRCHAQARYPEFGLPLPAAQSVAFDNNCLHIYDSSEKSFPPSPKQRPEVNHAGSSTSSVAEQKIGG